MCGGGPVKVRCRRDRPRQGAGERLARRQPQLEEIAPEILDETDLMTGETTTSTAPGAG